jgi:hypothetical protein
VDTIAIILKFPSGVLGSIDLSRHSSYGYDQRLEVRSELPMSYYGYSYCLNCVTQCRKR